LFGIFPEASNNIVINSMYPSLVITNGSMTSAEIHQHCNAHYNHVTFTQGIIVSNEMTTGIPFASPTAKIIFSDCIFFADIVIKESVPIGFTLFFENCSIYGNVEITAPNVRGKIANCRYTGNFTKTVAAYSSLNNTEF
jgi:hypothetical protein